MGVGVHIPHASVVTGRALVLACGRGRGLSEGEEYDVGVGVCRGLHSSVQSCVSVWALAYIKCPGVSEKNHEG